MSRFSVIELAQLPDMEVLETLDLEQTLSDRMAKLVELWKSYDPPNGAVYDVEGLEFDPIKINQEACTYFEGMLRDRVNQACRAITLAFSVGTDLDAIASRYPGGLPRLDENGDGTADEPDARYKRRIQASPNALSVYGNSGAYVFWAMTALPALRDASCIKLRTRLEDSPSILVTCMLEGTNPSPSAAQLTTVRQYIANEARQAFTDVVAVGAPKIKHCTYRIRVTLFPGPDKTTVLDAVEAALASLCERQRMLGYDHTRMAISAACAISGVYNAEIIEPASDVVVDEDWLVQVNNYVPPTAAELAADATAVGTFSTSPVEYGGRFE
jgi:phage-related baseplate assembly protein